jgi:hypothetical protein
MKDLKVANVIFIFYSSLALMGAGCAPATRLKDQAKRMPDVMNPAPWLQRGGD